MLDKSDEIDLRPYLLAVLRKWWQIVLLAVLAGAVTIGLSLLQPRTYKSTATILVTRTRTNLALADRFPTVNEPIDARSRMEAFLAISRSETLAQDTITNLGDRLPQKQRSPESLIEAVSIESRGDAILVTASAVDPALAAEIANTWALQTVTAINQAYSAEQIPLELEDQLETTWQEYESSQAALEAFIRENPSRLLQVQIDESQRILNNLSEDTSIQLAYYKQRKQLMEQVIFQAESLKEQIKDGSRSKAAQMGDALAVLQARALAFGISTNPVSTYEQVDPRTNSRRTFYSTSSDTLSQFTLNLQLQDLSGVEDNAAAYLADLDRLIEQAKAEKIASEASLENIAGGFTQEPASILAEQIATQIQTAEMQLEQATARKNQLTSQRDLSWQAYKSLVEKATEIKSSSQANNPVNLALSAYPPQEPASRGMLLKTLIAGVLGFLVGVVWVVGTYWWRTNQLNRPYPVAAAETVK